MTIGPLGGGRAAVLRRAFRSAAAVAALAGVAAPPASAQVGLARTPVAVVEFQTEDASAYPDAAGVRALLLTSGKTPQAWLASELTNSGRYAVIDPARVAAALDAQDLTPARCTDVACAAELGKALGVDHVITGQVSKLSNLIWFLHATMVDVSAARVRHREEFELKGNIAELLPLGMRALSRRFVSKDPHAPHSPETPAPVASSGPAQGVRLTREQVLAALADATGQAPADLSGRDLSGLDLSGVDFKRANLSKSRLAGANFSRAQMFAVTLSDAVASDANFSGAVLDVAVMRGTDFTRADLRDASLYATILIGANLTDANLSGARVIAALTNAKLAGTKLVRAHLGADPGNQPMGLMRTDLTGSDLRGADLSGANLRKADLTRTDLTGADLTDADLTGADLTGTVLRSIRGRNKIRGLEQAKNLEQAVFND